MEIDLAELIDSLPGLVWTALVGGEIDHVGKRWVDYTGLSNDESAGQGWTAAIHPEDTERLLAVWDAVRASGEIGEAQAQLRRHDGSYRWFLFRASPIRAPSGELLRWCGMNFDIDDRMRAEEAARELRRRYEEVLDGLPGNVALFTADGAITFANRRMLAYLDESLEQLQTRPATELVHREDRDKLQAEWAVAVPSGQPFEFESRLRRADGVYRWHWTGMFPLRNQRGEIELWYTLSTDIDDTKRAQAQLAAEKRLLELVALGVELPQILTALCEEVEALSPGSYCGILRVDPATQAYLTGVSPNVPDSFRALAENRPINPQVGPNSLAATLGTLVIVPDIENDPRWPESPWRTQALDLGLRSCWAAPVLSSDNDVVGTFFIHRCIPQSPDAHDLELIDRFTKLAGIAICRAQVEADLQASDAELRQTYMLLSEAQTLSKTGSFIWDVQNDEHNWSDEERRIWEFDPTAKITLAMILGCVHPDDIPAAEAVIGKAVDEESFELEFRIVTKSGAVKHLHVLGHRLAHIADRPVFFGAIQDITERKTAEEAANRARAELAHVTRLATMSALTASIAHEVNQPLAGIMTNASTCLRMLAVEPPNLQGARATAERTIRDANRASEVIKRLRAMFGRKQPGTDSVDLNEAAREVLTLSTGELQGARVMLQTAFADDLPAICGDRVQLQQVILNLVLNAIDAMRTVEGRPRLLEIATSREPSGEVRLSVRDQGIGFNTEDSERLFDAFYSTKSSGMGVGLSVSRSIIEGHQGRLWAVSNDHGPGATFFFALPRDLPQESGGARLEISASTPPIP